ncbi:TPA: hypothetical protein ON570_005018, partial [Citrobacter werkmanii]|nr:hypothetical protein [Citrobacter werkmanii]
GMEPLITIGGDGYTVTNGGNTAEQTAKVKVTGLTDANDNTSTVEGEMTFKTVVAAISGYTNSSNTPRLAAQAVEGNNQKYSPLSTNANYKRSLDKAWANQKLSVDYASAPYAGLTMADASIISAVVPGEAIKNPVLTKITGGVHSNIHSAQVTFPAATIPEVWEGALTVTVAYR